MNQTTSVSKACFAFPVPAKEKNSTLNSPLNFSKEDWYICYNRVWNKIVNQINEVEEKVIEGLLLELVNFISSPSSAETQIPAAAVLTGINLPDHGSLFSRLKSRLYDENIVNGVALLHSTECTTVKHAIERCIAQLTRTSIVSEEELMVLDEDEEAQDLKKSQCTLPNLVEWYDNIKSEVPSPSKRKRKSVDVENSSRKLIIILKDFETFNPNVLPTFIQILSGYLSKLPIVLVLGIATTFSAVDEALPYSSLSRLSLKPFQAQPSVYFLNNTLNKVFLSSNCPFQLTGKLFQFFTQVFLFYDFSVNRFIQGIKYCVLEHYRIGGRPLSLLCCSLDDLKANVDRLNRNDLNDIRKIKSFKSYVDSTDKETQKQISTDDSFMKKKVVLLMTELRNRIKQFYAALSLLHSLVAQLPQAPLGKQLRELYCVAMSKDIWVTAEYKECRQLLGFLSKEELICKVKQMIDLLNEHGDDSESIKTAAELKKHLNLLKYAGVSKVTQSPIKSPTKNVSMVKNRSELKQKVVELGNKNRSPYELAREDFLRYAMDEFFPSKLQPFSRTTLCEVVMLVESEARHRVVPRIRAPIHTALNNPAHYLMCDCCKLKENGEIIPTMPDICIAYKLHLESGSLINVYDWLQSFNVLVSGEQSEEGDVDMKVQARFTQAMSELEFLGFIKSSKKKIDHVARLTWGGSAS